MSEAQVAARRGPLDGKALPANETFSMTLAPAAARFILRGDAAVQAAGAGALGLSAPARLAASAGEGCAALWLGPDEVLLIAFEADAGAVRDRLAAALAGHLHSLVEVSQRQIGLVLSGRRAARVLSSGCPLDLRLAAFPVGMATRTLCAKSEIVLWRQAEDRFHVEVWRSFSPYLADYLTEAVRGAPDF